MYVSWIGSRQRDIALLESTPRGKYDNNDEKLKQTGEETEPKH